MQRTVVQFVTYQNAEDNQPSQIELPEDEFITLLTGHDETPCSYPCKKCDFKNGLAWSAGFIPPGKSRRDANVEFLDVVAFDFDHLSPQQFHDVCARLDDQRILIYSTHRHTPEEVRIRVVFFLTRRVLAKEFRALHAAVSRRFDLGDVEDKKARNIGRIFYLPSCPEGAPRIGVFNDGVPIDVDKLLVDQHLFSRAKKATPSAAPAPAHEPGAVDMESLRYCLKRYAPQDDFSGGKAALIKRVAEGEPLADKGGRDDAIHRASAILAYLLPLGTPPDAMLELIRPSIASIPQYEDDEATENPDGWLEKAAFSYERAVKRRYEEADAKDQFLARVRKKSHAVAAPPTAPAAPATPASPARPDAEEGEEDEDPEVWRLTLMTTTTKTGGVVVDRTPVNAALVFKNHPEWRGMLRYNVMRHEYEAIGGPLPASERDPDRLLTATQNWLAQHVGLNLQRNDVDAQLEYVARERMFDPIRAYLRDVKWDGVSRIGGWLTRYCGAEDSEYVGSVGMRWILAAVARALDPGCKADNVLVMEGPQSAGKSTTLRILGGEWFAEAKGANLNHRDTMELASKSWIVELPELSAMKRSETEAHKAFFSANDDKFRLAYARRVGEYKRRCVFAGTTNEDEYLHDDTGNRRYWTVNCSRGFDLDALRRDRDQLWAEAVAFYDAAFLCPACAPHLPAGRCEEHRWWFDRTENEVVEPVTVARLKSDLAGPIRTWYLAKEPKDRPEFVTNDFIASVILGVTIERTEAMKQGIGRAMKRLGFDRKCVVEDDNYRVWKYIAPVHLMVSPRVTDPRRRLTLVVNKPRASAPRASAPRPSAPRPSAPRPSAPTPPAAKPETK